MNRVPEKLESKQLSRGQIFGRKAEKPGGGGTSAKEENGKVGVREIKIK